MNILIVEDAKYKLEDIKKYVKNQYDVNRIVCFSSLMESLFFIKNNHEYIDLLVLDWCFPMYKGEHPAPSMGNDLLTYMREHNYNIDTIICSSDKVEINDNNVKKVITYIPNTYMDFTYNNKTLKYN